MLSARRDALVLAILLAAVALLIWNGSTFFQQLSFAANLGPGLQVASTALTLNVALILFGWRRYVDLQHEALLRADGEKRALVLASTDSHSGLLNRKGFADRAQALCETAARRGDQLIIFSVQVNRFKTINDRHGYEIGDSFLRILATELTAAVPPEAVVARSGGDEFAVAMALPAAALANATDVAAAMLRRITCPFPIDERMIQVGAFAGIAAAPAGEVRIPDLLRRADIAMDRARSGRSARPLWFDAGMERALVAQGEMEQGIRYGLDNDQFVPFFEPQVDLETGEIIGWEVLARWMHPSGDIIGPDHFIPVAEEIGLIGQLSETIIAKALVQAAAWDSSMTISVNISPTQLTDARLADRINALLQTTGFAPERLIIEITESSLFADLELAQAIVSSLKALGVRLALDDFGTGFSSLSHLRSLPFDMIKIDRSFVSNLHSNRESTAIIRAVATLANALGVPVCIEGIEDEFARASVLRLGCAVGQGWFFGKAMDAEQAGMVLAERAADGGERGREAASG